MSETKKTTQALFKRLEERGYPFDKDGVDAPFAFTVFPITSHGIADDQLIVDFSQKIRILARKLDFRKVRLEHILISLMVLDPEVPRVRNSLSFRRGIYRVKRQIDFVEWQAATTKGRTKLLREFMLQIVDELPNDEVREAALESLIDLVKSSS